MSLSTSRTSLILETEALLNMNWTKIIESIMRLIRIWFMYVRKLMSSPSCIFSVRIMFPPNQSTLKMHEYTTRCIIGWFRITIFSALTCVFRKSSAIELNLSLSLFSLTNAFTTRIAMRHSWTAVLSLSYFVNISEKRG